MEASPGSVSTPGEVLGSATEYEPGPGTYVWRGHVRASVLGVVSVKTEAGRKPTVEVRRKTEAAIPLPGSTVVAKIRKVTPRLVLADIVCVNGQLVNENFSGIIRQQDVRATEIDKVDLHGSFRPGDIIHALVQSLGDSRAYSLTTRERELGVVYAKSATSGLAMVLPLDADGSELMCPETFQREPRKAALLPLASRGFER